MPLLVMAISAALFSIVAAVALSWESRRHTIEAADRDNSNIARLVSFHISHVLRSSVRLLDDVAASVDSRGVAAFHSESGRKRLMDRARAYPEIQAIAVADEHGQLLASSGVNFPPADINYADREYFRRHQAGEDLVVGELIMSRTLGRRGTTVSRAIRSPRGELKGVVLVTLESQHFMQLIQRIRRSPNQAVSVLRLDGAVFVRSPEVELGARFPRAEVLERVAHAGSGTYFEARGAVDGLPRLLAFEAIDDFPLVVVASQSRDEVLAPWWTFTAFVAGGLVITLSALGLAAVFVFKSAAETEILQAELERQAHTDSLTGLLNRRHFLTLAEKELSRAERYGGPVAVLMMDIDHFKKINDTYGHQIGDEVLQRLAERCRLELRDIDAIGRMGGEEFAVLLPQTEADVALEVAERLRQVIAETAVPLDRGLPLHFTVSIGVAATRGAVPNIDTLLSQADDALYEAKDAGRNRIAVAA
ncbi:MAG TPA: sensor domain-containing diguanylate cyclase [Rhodocyclaceae bacterium]|nr:sensor domain-containing diguanylate cyclase [Rhodocyclaceae bacterium]